jgi:hypothetical protein
MAGTYEGVIGPLARHDARRHWAPSQAPQRESPLKASSTVVADVHRAQRAPGGIAQPVEPLLISGGRRG